MRIVTFIKQVPASTSVEINPETGTLIRGKEKGKLNPFDLFAIETALWLASQIGGEVIALSMGPLAAEDTLKEAIYMGVDDAYLISDMAFAGSDVLATSKTLAEAVKVIGRFDLIICGKQTTDGDTAQVGAETAEWLNIPHINNVVEIKECQNDGITVVVETEHELSTIYLPLPCLISVDKDINTPRLPSYLRKKSYLESEKTIKILTLNDLEDKDSDGYGMNGSPTRVVRIFEPDETTKSERIEGTPDEIASALFTALNQERLI
ncbi:MAG: electron transfer flavoprotein subunit beta/FixA family protein [Oscillospiraceae bacterium]|nr:electron transfer flavoprotein subunit beta/FixA family protein [Oscillospiraceae bacterium]